MSLRLVLDSMVWAQAAANPVGPSGQIVSLARDAHFAVVASTYIRHEVSLALRDRYFARRLGPTFDAERWLDTTLAACAEMVDVTGPPVLQDHAKDDPILWLAAAGGASHLVTWEGRLLDLKEHRFTRILTPPALLLAWRHPVAHEPLAEWRALRSPDRLPGPGPRHPRPAAAATATAT